MILQHMRLKLTLAGIVMLVMISGPASAGISLSRTDSENQIAIAAAVRNLPEISAFGFNIEYDTTQLTYKEYVKGNLIPASMILAVHEKDPGWLIVGGYTTDAPIPCGADGNIVILTFDKKTSAPGPDAVKILNLKDHISLDISDIILALKVLAGVTINEPENIMPADVTCDRKVSMEDLLVILQTISELRTD